MDRLIRIAKLSILLEVAREDARSASDIFAKGMALCDVTLYRRQLRTLGAVA